MWGCLFSVFPLRVLRPELVSGKCPRNNWIWILLLSPLYRSRSTNDSPVSQIWPDKFILQSVFVNEILLEHSTPISLCIVFNCLYPTTVKLNSCTRDYTARKAYNIYYLSLYRKGLQNLATNKKTGFFFFFF